MEDREMSFAEWMSQPDTYFSLLSRAQWIVGSKGRLDFEDVCHEVLAASVKLAYVWNVNRWFGYIAAAIRQRASRPPRRLAAFKEVPITDLFVRQTSAAIENESDALQSDGTFFEDHRDRRAQQRAELEDQYERLVGMLSQEQRTVLILLREGYSHTEVARVLDRSNSWVTLQLKVIETKGRKISRLEQSQSDFAPSPT